MAVSLPLYNVSIKSNLKNLDLVNQLNKSPSLSHYLCRIPITQAKVWKYQALIIFLPDYDVIGSFSVTVVNMRLIQVNWGLIHSTLPSFTLQYRKIGVSSWTEKMNIATNTTTINPSEKYETFEVRLISAKGILMLDKIVTGGSSFLDSVKFHFKKGKL